MKWSVLFAAVFVGTSLASADDGCCAPAPPASEDQSCAQQAVSSALTCEPNCAAPLTPDQCFPACEPGQDLGCQLGCYANGCNGCSCDPCGCDPCHCGHYNCDGYCDGYKGKCHGCKGDKCKGKWCLGCPKCDPYYCDRCSRKCYHLFEESTCDMYHHIPYYPMMHGYYYFRPYNYQHVPEQKQLAPGLGEKYVAPYQTMAFAMLYRDIESGYDVPQMFEIPKPKPTSEGLPDLQEILKN